MIMPAPATQPFTTSGYANATSLYATFQATEKLSLNGRAEYFSQSKANAFAGLPGQVFAFTGTAQYDLWKNVISRVEFRWDHQADGTGHAYGASNCADFLGGTVATPTKSLPTSFINFS